MCRKKHMSMLGMAKKKEEEALEAGKDNVTMLLEKRNQ